MSDEPISLAERRWDRNTKPSASSVADMLRVVIARIERGEIVATHAIVTIGIELDNGCVDAKFYQAGTFNPYAQIGLLTRVAQTMMMPADEICDHN